MKKIVGCNSIEYNEIRNFAGAKLEKYQHRKVQNLHKLPAIFSSGVLKTASLYYWNSFRDYDLNGCDLLHFFNGISYGKTPWITTVESILPRWGNVSESLKRRALHLLAGDSCKRLVAFSNAARARQIAFLDGEPDELKNVIIEKLTVLYPYQKQLPQSEKIYTNDIEFSLVGHQFFRKGGGEILKVFDALLRKGLPIRLTIVSRLDYGDSASGSSKSDYLAAVKIIDNHEKITHFPSLSNSDVVSLLLRSHVSLLPSYWDSFGYFVLESQAAGCPVITTDIQSFPEINNDQVGWLIDIPKNKGTNCALFQSEENRQVVSAAIINHLEAIICNIVDDPSNLKVMAHLARVRVATHHCYDKFSRELESIYDAALA